MKKERRVKTDYSITTLKKRLLAIIIAVAFLFLFVLGRMFYIQIIWGDNLQEKAIDQWTRDIPVIAERGKIYDANGILLAGNDDTYTVFVRKKAAGDIAGLCDVLEQTLGIDKTAAYERLTGTVSSEITVAKHVEKEKIDKLIDKGLNGVYCSRDNTRVYPYNELLSSVLGFTSTDGKGQSGLESYYDEYMSGIDGSVLYETDIVGVEIENGKASYIPARNGLNVKLTVDYEIQQLCEAAMSEAMEVNGAKSAKMIVINPKTGEIKALASKPSYDLNNVPRDDLSLTFSLGRNGIISDCYEPGSTFKVLTAAANVEEYLSGNNKAFSNDHIFNSSRYRYIDGQRVKCWSNHEHGKHASLNLQGALNNSCNPIFVDIAMSLGKTTMYKYIDLFGYGKTTGVDFSGEAQGMVVPLSAVTNVDLSRIAFGQTIAVTGLQLATATAAAINGGKYYTPYLVSEIFDDNGIVAEKITPTMKNRVISEKASETIREMLEGVVRDGSGKQAYIEGYRVGGKTGTAQKYENGVIAQGKYVASFVGFFPADNPEFLALVIIDEPQGAYYGSTVAAPYARQVFEGIIKIKNMRPYNS